MKSKTPNRRGFLKGGAAVAGLAAAAVQSGSGQAPESEARPKQTLKEQVAYGERSRFDPSVRTLLFDANPPPTSYHYLTPLQDSVGIITPSGLHMVAHHGPYLPDIEPEQHRLMIHGLVDHPVTFTMDDLRRLPSVSHVYFVECNDNSRPRRDGRNSVQDVHGRASCSEWTGVPLSLILGQAGVQKGAGWVLAEGSDPLKYSKSIPLAKIMQDALVAYGQNGEALRPEQGFPLRLVCPGWEGIAQVKWLSRIKVTDQPEMSKWETMHADMGSGGKRQWFLSQKGPKSVITFPAEGGRRLSGPGFYEISGLAWTGGGVIRKVEVSTDGGRTWKEAQLQEPVHRMAFTRFRLNWRWDGEETVLQSRCVDEQGEVQPTIAELAGIVGVKSDFLKYFQNVDNFDNYNAIQPWRVKRDGTVQNALA